MSSHEESFGKRTYSGEVKMTLGDFETWIRQRCSCSWCMEQGDFRNLLRGNLNLTSGEYTYYDQGVQAQWEAWKAAVAKSAELTKRHQL